MRPENGLKGYFFSEGTELNNSLNKVSKSAKMYSSVCFSQTSAINCVLMGHCSQTPWSQVQNVFHFLSKMKLL